MKKKNGFTLIELLAVIIILGILMIIAIPSVTKYISDSRKSAYIDTAKEIIGGARNLVNDGKLEMYDTDTTYYIESSCIKTENASKSPYGDFTKAYVVVTYDGNGYTYYWTSNDDSGQGIKDVVRVDKLDIDNIDSDLKDTDISTLRGIDGRSKTVVISKQNNCQKEGANQAGAQINGETGDESINAITLISQVTGLVDAADAKRFVGSNPNNYVKFNGNELWRIIGIYGDSLKIIKDESIGTMTLSCPNNYSRWPDCGLAQYLNNEYYNSLSDTSKTMIKTGTWNLGQTDKNATASEAYSYSKNDIWSGNVGIIASYEYLYNADESCYSISGYHFDQCSSRGWLLQEYRCSRTLTLVTQGDYILHVENDGSLGTGYMLGTGSCSVMPVVYLKSSVNIKGGTGTSGDPYVLG